jgi:two-component system OmpR family sensor kinase
MNPESPGVRDKAVDLLDRGLTGIRDVVRALLSIHRPERDLRPISEADFDDLRMLIGPQLGNVRLDWSIAPLGFVGTAAGPVRQMMLNLLLNAIAAAGENGNVGLTVAATRSQLSIAVTNSGPPMPEAIAAFLEGRGPADASGNGLGVWLVRQIASELRANVSVECLGAAGVRVSLTVPIMETRHDAG